MEPEELLRKIGRIAVSIALLGSAMVGSLTILTHALFDYLKLLKYLWRSW
jgi:hypothetical protein